MPETPAIEPLTVDNDTAAKLLGIGKSHWHNMLRSGRVGPEPIRLGRRRLYILAQLKAWVEAGCPARQRWQAMRGGSARRIG